MNRSDFLHYSSSWVAGVFLSQLTEKIIKRDDKGNRLYDKLPVIPFYLKNGDLVGITSPAGYISLEEIQSSVELLESWGFTVRVGSTIGKRNHTFGGTDEERAADFQAMLDDPAVSAILCARGGYGAVRIIDRLNWDRFRTHPKWVIGFSDITVFHSHILRNLDTASIHSKMCNSFPDNWNKAEAIQIETILSIQKALSGEPMKYIFPANPMNRLGDATGVLTGGNLKTLESLSGTRSDIVTEGKILFVEDTGEYLYSIDRMFWNLKRTGKLENLAGLVVGGFKIKPDPPGEGFGKSLEEVVLEKVQEFNYPVCFDFPVGHQKNNFALKCGVVHEIELQSQESRLIEIR